MASTRFPEKPLALLDGVPMVRRVYDNCPADIDTFVLTDDQRVADVIPEGQTIVDDRDYQSGTERCFGALSQLPNTYDKVINVQGDMPDINRKIIRAVKDKLDLYDVTTAYTTMEKRLQKDPNCVKLIRTGDYANWFCRASLEYGDWHLGIYGYRSGLAQILKESKPSREEEIEKLEQLRWIQNGIEIGCVEVQFNGTEINTPEDLKQWHKQNSQ
jgi:3-deoxy-manno-octulosonate cytidylyltransferase (CMP-KDO synthetase)